jgi:[ribosomal protein S18]-alanine N-acetyltransferase
MTATPGSGGAPRSDGAPGSDGAVRLDRFRWWHIEPALALEHDLFGVEAWSAAMFWNELAAGNRYRAALDGDRLVGYAGITVSPGGEAWVNNLAVRREYQRHGIGARLLEELLAIARTGRARAVLLEVAAPNATAQRLYARYGFEPVAVRRGYYQPSNTDAVVMRRDEEGGNR